jgi:hypothetical protein
MSEYLFLFRGVNRDKSPEEMQQHMQKWMTWITELSESGRMPERGRPLEDGGKTVRGTGKAVTDGPYAEKDIVSGFLIINAKDIDEAVEVSKGCPIFEGDGAVEVRPVMAM